jgi:ABC-type antimicrobial peptide transport system permease subunit
VLQFLTEAVVLTGLGGLIGMTVGYGWFRFVCRLALVPSLPYRGADGGPRCWAW